MNLDVSSSPPGILVVMAAVSAGSVALAWIAVRIFRAASAAFRHFIWLLAVCAPLLALPSSSMRARIALPVLPPSAAPRVNPAALPTPQGAPGIDSTSIEPGAKALEPNKSIVRFDPWLTIWILGAAFATCRVLLSRARIKRLIGNVWPPGSMEVIERLNATRESFGFDRPVSLMITEATEVPFCYGVLNPTIIFPRSWDGWDKVRIDICLAHEVAHLVRGDLFAMLAGQVACILCWFNPLMWLAVFKLRDEAEIAADDLVLSVNVPPDIYAANLVGITEECQATNLAPAFALSMTRVNRLTSRVGAILDSTVERKSPGAGPRLVVTLLAAGALLGGITVRLTSVAAAPAPSGSMPDNEGAAGVKKPSAVTWDAGECTNPLVLPPNYSASKTGEGKYEVRCLTGPGMSDGGRNLIQITFRSSGAIEPVSYVRRSQMLIKGYAMTWGVYKTLVDGRMVIRKEVVTPNFLPRRSQGSGAGYIWVRIDADTPEIMNQLTPVAGGILRDADR